MAYSPIKSPPTFALRARLWGAVHWICPYSGHLNQSPVNANHYRLMCSPGECNRRFVPGIVLYPTRPGRYSIPPDWVIPIPGEIYNSTRGLVDIMPMGDLAIVPWKRHTPTHVLIEPDTDDPAAYDVRLFVRHVRQIAQFARQDDFDGLRISAGLPNLARLGAGFLAASAMGGFVDPTHGF
jgi:hypothetical protein